MFLVAADPFPCCAVDSPSWPFLFMSFCLIGWRHRFLDLLNVVRVPLPQSTARKLIPTDSQPGPPQRALLKGALKRGVLACKRWEGFYLGQRQVL